ncbi:hypothetical protein KCM76_12185 [Zooshikella marina]|uniref:DUF2282 domain-containing protein n=1 Tax=Zooshikella ganghwensis TaxID=202772 RepID=A0A4P9VKR7_9GAMM|nr:hypothetical protein [Zooshikella ganghwensis]MBU2706743.1 hypothetical protein [Zooshikella ganghwensis]RDH43898.1 hypothetical protein B9G39_10835 [Zooshikella ganghwensis]
MSTMKKVSGTALAVAAAGLFTMGAELAVAGQADQVKCWGINSCKGHNDCATATNDCKGMGSCKGQGYLNMSAEECKEKGGTVKE